MLEAFRKASVGIVYAGSAVLAVSSLAMMGAGIYDGTVADMYREAMNVIDIAGPVAGFSAVTALTAMLGMVLTGTDESLSFSRKLEEKTPVPVIG